MITIQKDNDSLKQKFAQLLDQFQEYVNINEERQAEEEEKHQ